MTLNVENDSFKNALTYSFAAHLLIFILLFVRAAFFSNTPLAIENAVQVDLVGLPDKVTPQAPVEDLPVEKPKAEPPPPPKELPTPPNAIKEAVKTIEKSISLKRANRQSDAIKRLQAMEKIERMLQEQKSRAPIKGNQISKGSSLTGVVKLDYDQYLGSLEKHIRKSWALPEWLASADLHASVRVFVDANGYVTRRELIQSSQNPIFDAKVLEAVDRSSPFPVPPSRLADRIELEGMVFGFPI